MTGPRSTNPGAAGPVTVLGASGFVGTALVHRLAARPGRLRLVGGTHPVRIPPDPVAQVDLVAADLTDPAQLAAAVAGSSAVVHLAVHRGHGGDWRTGDAAAEAVTVGVMRGLLAALPATAPGPDAPVVLYAGAVSQVGPTAPMRVDGHEPDAPTGAYDRRKLAAQHLLDAATAAGAVRGATLRLPTVIGCPPGVATSTGIVAAMIGRAVAGLPLTMWHDGTVRRDLLHVDDVAAAFAAALDHPDDLAGRHWLLGSGHGRELGPVFTRIAELVAARTGRPAVPVTSVPPPAHAEAGDFHSVAVDASAFTAATGWRPTVDLDDALTRTVAALAR